MSKGDANLQLHKSLQEIKVKHEDEKLHNSVIVMDPLEKDMEFGEKKLEDESKKTDKIWVKNALEKLEKKEEERQQAEKERQQQEKQQQEKNELNQFIFENLNVAKNRLHVHIPTNTTLDMSYGAVFRDRISYKKRMENKKNNRSRLYQKETNAKVLENNLKRHHDKIYDRSKTLVDKKAEIDASDFNDLSQFLLYKNTAKNKELCDLMLGGKNKKGEPCVDKHHAQMALVMMADQLLQLDFTGIKLNTDHDIVENAAQLESITNRLAAFYRLSEKYDFMNSLDEDKRKALNHKLDGLKAVAAYYTIRKEIISDQEYIDHYDDELSMDIKKAGDARQRVLAEKLCKSFAIGKKMIESYGLKAKNLNKLRIPAFTSNESNDYFNQVLNEYNQNASVSMPEIIKSTYAKSDEAATEHLNSMKHSLVDDFEVMDKESFITEEEAERKQERMRQATLQIDQKSLFVSKLLTADELNPLQGLEEMKLVTKDARAVQAILVNTMPPLDKRKDIDDAILAVTMLYSRVFDSVGKLIKRVETDYPDAASMLRDLSANIKNEGDLFREKTLEYIDIVQKDQTLNKKTHIWMDALKYSRGMFYDLDNDKTLSYKMEGEGASTLYKITRNTKAGKETVYFKIKDSVPIGDNDELVASIVSKYNLKDKTKNEMQEFLSTVMVSSKAGSRLYFAIKAVRKDTDLAKIGQKVLSKLNADYNRNIKVGKDEYQELGSLFKEWFDNFGKRSIAHDMPLSAKIDYGRNLSDRNVATSRFATLLGMQDMVCDSRTAMIRVNGQVLEGNIMESSGGVETTSAKAAYSIKAITQLFQLQIFDFICGQTDRHYGNFHGIIKNGKIDQIRCLDNDMAFGKVTAERAAKGYNSICPVTAEAILGLPSSFLNRILALDRPFIEQVMGDILNKEEIDNVMDRLNFIKGFIQQIPASQPNTKWDAEKKQLTYTGLMADDEYRALTSVKGLMQKAKKNNVRLEVISKFVKSNVERTNIDKMIDQRKLAVRYKEQQKGKKS